MTPNEGDGTDSAPELAALADPARRQLYEFVAAQGAPVRRDTAAEAIGISRTLAAYHLDRLVDAGLLSTSYARPEGQTGPGAGRPAKLYRATHEELSVSLPPRTYDVLAALLADAVDSDRSGAVQGALFSAAEAEGSRAGAEGGDLLDTLRRRGYDPEVVDGEIDLHNCPFHQLAQRHVDLVCGLNHSLLRGVVVGHGGNAESVHLAPRPGHCCVTISTSEDAAGRSD